MLHTGFIPPAARPPLMVTACSSAMPTSKKRCGYVWAKGESPVPIFMAAVTAQMEASCRASSVR